MDTADLFEAQAVLKPVYLEIVNLDSKIDVYQEARISYFYIRGLKRSLHFAECMEAFEKYKEKFFNAEDERVVWKYSYRALSIMGKLY